MSNDFTLRAEHFNGLRRGKARGILTFYALLGSQVYEVTAKGSAVTDIHPVDLEGNFVMMSIAVGQPRPACPVVAPDLIAHARSVAKAQGW